MQYFINHNKLYSAPQNIKGGSLLDEIKLTKSDCSVIHNIYDSLVEKYPEFITKTKLGEVFGDDINCYSIKNFEMKNFSSFKAKRFKSFIQHSVIIINF